MKAQDIEKLLETIQSSSDGFKKTAAAARAFYKRGPDGGKSELWLRAESLRSELSDAVVAYERELDELTRVAALLPGSGGLPESLHLLDAQVAPGSLSPAEHEALDIYTLHQMVRQRVDAAKAAIEYGQARLDELDRLAAFAQALAEGVLPSEVVPATPSPEGEPAASQVPEALLKELELLRNERGELLNARDTAQKALIAARERLGDESVDISPAAVSELPALIGQLERADTAVRVAPTDFRLIADVVTGNPDADLSAVLAAVKGGAS